MTKKLLIVIIAILLIIGIDAAGVLLYLNYYVGYTNTYISSHQLAQRTLIKEEDLIEVKVPKDYINSDTITDKNEIIGKYVKLSYSIPKGSFIYKSSIEKTSKDLNNTLLMSNQVSYDIYTNEVKVNSGTLNKNMYVDLYLTIPNSGKPISDLFLSNARIIGLYDTNEKEILNYDTNSKVSIISLAVSEDEVKYINKALILGDIKIIVSNHTYDTNVRSSLNDKSDIFAFFQ